MSTVDQTSRTAFFPKSKDGQTAKTKKSINSNLVNNRNDNSRINELKNFTQRDAKVNIPEAVKDFSRIKKAVDASPEMNNSDRIADLKARIKNGTYDINYEALADKMLQDQF